MTPAILHLALFLAIAGDEHETGDCDDDEDCDENRIHVAVDEGSEKSQNLQHVPHFVTFCAFPALEVKQPKTIGSLLMCFSGFFSFRQRRISPGESCTLPTTVADMISPFQVILTAWTPNISVQSADQAAIVVQNKNAIGSS